MSEPTETSAATAAERESWFERDVDRDEPGAVADADPDGNEAEAEGPADPQEWLEQLTEELRRAEQGGFGSGPRDALAARIRLANAYSELGDSVSAAPLAVQNVAQAEELFPSSEGMLAQLREFRDAACEAAGWTAAMMRTAEPEPVVVIQDAPDEPMLIDELTGAADALAAAETAVADEADLAAAGHRGEDGAEAGAEAVAEAGAETGAADGPANETTAEAGTATDPEAAPDDPARAARPADAPRGPFTADARGTIEAPGAIVVAEPAADDIEDAEEVLPVSDGAAAVELAAYEEIVRLRYELRDARRTIARLRHVNRKLREALEYEPE